MIPYWKSSILYLAWVLAQQSCLYLMKLGLDWSISLTRSSKPQPAFSEIFVFEMPLHMHVASIFEAIAECWPS